MEICTTLFITAYVNLMMKAKAKTFDIAGEFLTHLRRTLFLAFNS